MLIAIHASIDEIPAVGWNRLAGTQPFLQHEFLAALEHAGCVGGSTGWQPQHLTCTDDRGKLVGALPLYLKNHSWGEFVFDWAWAEAWQRAGRNYYPKLVAAVPFTPVTGSRLLVAPGAERSQIRAALINQAIALAAERQCSSIHCLFPEDAEISDWSGQGFLTREDCQFHWHNRDYQSFNDYLGTLTAQKRKKLKRERRRVREAGIGFRTRYGGELTSSELDALYTLYAATYLKRGHQPYLNPDFFREIAATLPTSLLVNFAMLDERLVACAICFRGGDTLYGRHWGCLEEYHSLHFETCYYQWLDYCIRERLAHFDPGAQGEHKLARGFEPTATHSLHYIEEPAFRAAVQEFLQQETRWMDRYIVAAAEHLPFHQPTVPLPL